MLVIVTMILIMTFVMLAVLNGGTRGEGRRRSRRVTTTSRAIGVLVVSGGHVGLGSTNLPRRVVRRAPGLVHHSGLPMIGTGIKPEIVSLVTSRRVFSRVPLGGRIGTSIDNVCVATIHNVEKPLRGPGGGGNFHTEVTRGCDGTGRRLGTRRTTGTREGTTGRTTGGTGRGWCRSLVFVCVGETYKVTFVLAYSIFCVLCVFFAP